MTIPDWEIDSKALSGGRAAMQPGVGRGALSRLLQQIPSDVLVVGIMLLTASAAFGLGVLAGKGSGTQGGFSIQEIPLASSSPAAAAAALDAVPADAPASLPAGGEYVGAQGGSKYYLPWCSGASRIAEANRVYFSSKAAAEAAGYSAATACKGI